MCESEDTTILANAAVDDEMLILSFDESDGEDFLATDYSMESWQDSVSRFNDNF